MTENYRTIGRYQLSLSTAHVYQTCTICSIKSDALEFPK